MYTHRLCAHNKVANQNTFRTPGWWIFIYCCPNAQSQRDSTGFEHELSYAFLINLFYEIIRKSTMKLELSIFLCVFGIPHSLAWIPDHLRHDVSGVKMAARSVRSCVMEQMELLHIQWMNVSRLREVLGLYACTSTRKPTFITFYTRYSWARTRVWKLRSPTPRWTHVTLLTADSTSWISWMSCFQCQSSVRPVRDSHVSVWPTEDRWT